MHHGLLRLLSSGKLGKSEMPMSDTEMGVTKHRRRRPRHRHVTTAPPRNKTPPQKRRWDRRIDLRSDERSGRGRIGSPEQRSTIGKRKKAARNWFPCLDLPYPLCINASVSSLVKSLVTWDMVWKLNTHVV